MNLIAFMRNSKLLRLLTSSLSPTLIVFAAALPQLAAQSYPEWQVSLQFPPTVNRGTPSITTGAGTRGSSCAKRGKMLLTALMPTCKNKGQTVAANPTLFWYVPTTTARSAEFVVADYNGEVYKTTVALSSQPGIVKLSIPKAVSLKTGQEYTWKFALIRPPGAQSQNNVVKGKIQRVELSPELKSQLERAAPLERAKLYADARIWQETLSIVADVRRSNPEEWEELLDSVGLGDIAKEPFMESGRNE